MLGYSIYDRVMNSLFRDPLFSIQSPLSNRDKKQIPGGFIDLQRKGVRVGEEENIIFLSSARALARLLRLRARGSFRKEK